MSPRERRLSDLEEWSKGQQVTHVDEMRVQRVSLVQELSQQRRELEGQVEADRQAAIEEIKVGGGAVGGKRGSDSGLRRSPSSLTPPRHALSPLVLSSD